MVDITCVECGNIIGHQDNKDSQPDYLFHNLDDTPYCPTCNLGKRSPRLGGAEVMAWAILMIIILLLILSITLRA